MATYESYDDFLQNPTDVKKAMADPNACKLIVCNTCANSSTQIYITGITFNYTGSDQYWCIPVSTNYCIKVWGAGAGCRGKGGYSAGCKELTKGDYLSIMAGQKGRHDGASYGFGGAAGYCNGMCIAGAGMSGVFTGCSQILPTDTDRAIIIAGGSGGTRHDSGDSYWGGAGGGSTGGNANYNGAAGGTGTGRGNGGYNPTRCQFCGATSESTYYGGGGGGGWWGGNAGCAYRRAPGGGGSGYIGGVTNGTTTQGGATANANGCVNIKIV